MLDPQLASAQTAQRRRRGVMIGMIVLALLVLSVGLWRLSHRAPNIANDMESAFATLKPEIVAITAPGAPTITEEDVTGSFYMVPSQSPANAMRDTAKAFAAHAPQQVWLLADTSWADAPAREDLGGMLAGLKARGIPAALILPPQANETDEGVVDALAALSHENGATFLDYHDASKLASVDCPTDEPAGALTTQKMLLQMGINAPETREYLRLADIAARIETMEEEKGCGAAIDEAPAEDAGTGAGEQAPPAE